MSAFKLCKCGTWCATGYCLDCRRKDELAKAEIAYQKRQASKSKQKGTVSNDQQRAVI